MDLNLLMLFDIYVKGKEEKKIFPSISIQCLRDIFQSSNITLTIFVKKHAIYIFFSSNVLFFCLVLNLIRITRLRAYK
jgi:hypothetical protein